MDTEELVTVARAMVGGVQDLISAHPDRALMDTVQIPEAPRNPIDGASEAVRDLRIALLSLETEAVLFRIGHSSTDRLARLAGTVQTLINVG